MTDKEKSALIVLGYAGNTWDNREPHSTYKLWGGLTEEERKAAEVLGYKATRWNDKKNKAKDLPIMEKSWSEMTFEEQTALEVLGFNEKAWDAGSSGRPQSYRKSWEELTVCGQNISVVRPFCPMQ